MEARIELRHANPKVIQLLLAIEKYLATRIWVSLILDFLASGTTEAELIVEYPQLGHEGALAAIAYGAEAARV